MFSCFGSKKTPCALFDQKRCIGKSDIQGDELCEDCYKAHPLVFAEFLDDHPTLQCYFDRPGSRILSANERYERFNTCVSQRKKYRDHDWVKELYKIRYIKGVNEAYELGSNRKSDGDVICSWVKSAADVLCDECASVVKNKGFKSPLPDGILRN